MKRFILITTLVCLAIVPVLSAQDTYTGEKEDSLSGEGIASFRIELGSGFDVQIQGTDTRTISYSYAFEGNRVAHERNFERAEYRLMRNGSEALLRIEFLELATLQKNVSWIRELFSNSHRNLNIEKQELIIKMPRDIAVQLQTRYSDIIIGQIDREVNIQNRSGGVVAMNIGGVLNIDNEYGNIIIENISGGAMINSRSSEISAKQVREALYVTSNYSNVTASDIESEVQIGNRSGTIELSDVRGSANIVADYTTMDIHRIEGDVQIQSRSGELDISEVRTLEFNGEYTGITASQISGTGGVHIQNRSSEVELRNITGEAVVSGEYIKLSLNNLQGNLSVTNRSGSVHANRLDGAVSITGQYIDIDLDDFRGSQLLIRNQSQDVNIASTGVLSDVNIEMTYGDLNLTMAREYQGQFSLTTRYGSINAAPLLPDVGIDGITDSNRRASEPNVITGITGNNRSNRMVINTRNGDINISMNR